MPDQIPTELKAMTFTMACNSFFGRLPGQTLQQFKEELKALDDNDRKYFVNLFTTVGIDATAKAQ